MKKLRRLFTTFHRFMWKRSYCIIVCSFLSADYAALFSYEKIEYMGSYISEYSGQYGVSWKNVAMRFAYV